MNIANCQLGFGNEVSNHISLNIYISGCKNNKNCPVDKCHNPELRKFDTGFDWTTWKQYIRDQVAFNFFSCFCILGGEPLDSPYDELISFFDYLKQFNLPIYLYSGYDYDQLTTTFYNFKDHLAGVYCGHYIEGSLQDNKQLVLFEKQTK